MMVYENEKKLVFKTRYQEEIPWYMQNNPFFDIVEDITYFCDKDGVPYWDEIQYFVYLIA